MYEPIDWQIWAMAFLFVIIMLSGGWAIVQLLALPDVPEKPSRLERARHALWNFL